MPTASITPLLGFAAFSGVGKTTLLKQLIPRLSAAGLRLGLLKHSHHGFSFDRPGKDSDLLRRAGATQLIIASERRTAHIVDHPRREPSFAQRLRLLDDGSLDLILVEGFKDQAMPKIELHRPTLEHPLLCPHDPHIIALACDAPPLQPVDIPLLDLNDPEAIARFILARFPLAGSVPIGQQRCQ